MATFPIITTLKALARSHNNIIVCKDIRIVTVPVGGTRVRRQIEMTAPIEYNYQTILKEYDGNTKVIKWDYTFTDDGQDAVAVVLEGRN